MRSYQSKMKQAALALAVGALASAANLHADYASEVLADGPLAYYRFNETFTVPPDQAANLGSLGTSAKGNYGGPPGSKQAPGALTGDANKAGRFNGSNQGIQVPWSSALNPAAPFSVEVWVKPDSVRATDSRVSPFASLVRASPAATGWIFYQNAGAWEFWMGDAANNYTAQLNGGGAPNTNTWYHLVGTYDGSTVLFYVNGVEVARKENETRYAPNPANPLGIGQRGDNNFWFPGSVDEPAVYGSVLSAATVLAHYQAATQNPGGYEALVLGSSPLGYWRLNELPVAFPVAANSGPTGIAADASFYGGSSSTAGPSGAGFPGFEPGNRAVALNGTNGYVGTPVSLNNRSNITIMGWVQIPGSVTVDNRDGFIGQNDLAEFGWHNATTEFGMWTPGAGGYVVFNPNQITRDTWHSIAAVMSGTNITLYLDGNLTISGGGTVNSYGSNLFNVNIGGGGVLDGWGNWFSGQMDEVAIYDKVLTSGRIKSLHLAATGDANPPTLLTEPPPIRPDIVYATTTFSLSMDAAGLPPLTYQWRHEGTNLPGATSSALSISNADPNLHSGNYDVIVANPNGAVTSLVAYVYVNPLIPVYFQSQPKSQMRYEGGRALFFADVQGTEPAFQWYFNGTPIPTGTNATLVINPVTPGAVGSYTVRASNAAGPQTSEAATLGIRTPPADSFEELVVGLEPVAYWRLNETLSVFESTTAWDHQGAYDGAHSFGVETGVVGPRPPLFPGIEADNAAARYDGVSAGTTTGVPLLNNRAQFSILGWFKPQVQTTGRVALFGQNDVAEFGYHGTGTVGLWTPGGGFISFGTNLLTPGEWYFITATADGNQMRIYLNGRQVAAGGNATANYGSSSSGFNIGTATLDTTGNFFLGDIDDVAFFDRALTLSEVYAINSKATGVELELGFAPVNVIVKDSKPAGIPHDGYNDGAVWLASDNDGVRARDGVMRFDGVMRNQIAVPWHADFSTPVGSVSFWMRSAGTVGNGNEGAMLIDRRTTAGDVIVQAIEGQIFWQPRPGTYTARTTGTVTNDLWRHVAYVYDQESGGSISIYIDGVLDSTQLNTSAWSWPVAPIEIGRSHDGWWRAYDGLLDDIRFYSVQLSAGQIAQIAAGDSPVVAEGSLVGRYNFDTAPALGLRITWPIGVLEAADDVEGPYTAVPNAVSPYVANPTAAKKFYRVRL